MALPRCRGRSALSVFSIAVAGAGAIGRVHIDLAGAAEDCVRAAILDPKTTNAILTAMLGASVMMRNVTRLALDVGEVLLRGAPADAAETRNRAACTLTVIVGFAVGRGLGAVCEAAFGLWSLALPASLALFVFAMGFAA